MKIFWMSQLLMSTDGTWFQQDGASPSFHRNVREYLDNNFTNITPLDFFLWGLLKERVCQTPVLTIEEPKQRIHDERMAITPETLCHVQRFFLNRVEACLLQNRMHFDQFLR
jgi:hypothetical protein